MQNTKKRAYILCVTVLMECRIYYGFDICEAQNVFHMVAMMMLMKRRKTMVGRNVDVRKATVE